MTTELERRLTRLKQGDHVCLIYENTAEQLAAAVPFIKEGLARGERCIYAADGPFVDEAVRTLVAAGVDVTHEFQRGAFRSLPTRGLPPGRSLRPPGDPGLRHQAHLLGVRRAGVTGAVGPLQERGLIGYRWGRFVILDRQGLEAASCDCYRTIRAEYERLFG